LQRERVGELYHLPLCNSPVHEEGYLLEYAINVPNLDHLIPYDTDCNCIPDPATQMEYFNLTGN